MQGIASLCFGLFTGLPAKILVGPGNRFVAEAKRTLYGRVGIDMFAGPTEIGIIADADADPLIVAEDLTSQAEHGPESPCWLITTDRTLGEAVMGRIDSHIQSLPEPARSSAEAAWRDHGEVVLCATDEEACLVSDDYAPEHLEIHTTKNEWYVQKLRNYRSIVGAEVVFASISARLIYEQEVADHNLPVTRNITVETVKSPLFTTNPPVGKI